MQWSQRASGFADMASNDNTRCFPITLLIGASKGGIVLFVLFSKPISQADWKVG